MEKVLKVRMREMVKQKAVTTIDMLGKMSSVEIEKAAKLEAKATHPKEISVSLGARGSAH